MMKNQKGNDMPNTSNNSDHIKRLERQIAHDQSQPVKPSEKRVKLNTTFDNAVKQLSQKPLKRD